MEPNGHTKGEKKICIHCFVTHGGRQKHIRLNHDPAAVGDDYIIGVDFMGEIGDKISAEKFQEIAKYLAAQIQVIDSKLIIPGDGELVQKHPIIAHNRASRRAVN